MKRLKLTCLILLSMILSTACADPAAPKTLIFDEATLSGTYVHSGQVLLNPPAMTDEGTRRVTISCFSIGTLHFNGKGSVRRDVEIFCPSTENFLALGLPAAPIGEPSPDELAAIGSSLSMSGSYVVDEDGWGTIEEEGAFRLGPVVGAPATGRLAFTIGRLGARGVAREIHLLVKNISVQFPGAPGLVNSDIGTTLLATHR